MITTSWYLIVSGGPEAGSGFQLTGPSVTVGRTADNDIAIDDNMVSRHQARLDMQGNTYTLTDLGSTNGTWVNGRRISEPAPLRAGDSVRFGKRADFVLSTQPSLKGDETLSGDRTFAGQDMVPGGAPVPPAPVVSVRPPKAVGGGLVCAACGHANRPGVRFCESCGQPLAVAEPICPACGARNRPGIRFCENCGQPLFGAPRALPHAAPRFLHWAVRTLAVLVVVAAIGLTLLLFLNPDGVRDIFSPPSEPNQALTLADEFVAAQFPGYVGAERQLTPATEEGHRVFVVRYTRAIGGGSTETLLVAVNPVTEEVKTLEPKKPK